MLQNLLFLITGFIGLITLLLIFANYKSNIIMNIYIVILIALISLRYFFEGINYFILNRFFEANYLKYSNLALLAFPLCYLYFKNLSTTVFKFDSKELFHFIFPISFFLFAVNYNNSYFPLLRINYILYSIFFVFAIAYTFLCFRVLKKNIWTKKNEVILMKNQNKLIKSWTSFLFIAVTLITFRLLIAIFFDIYHNQALKGKSHQWISSLIWLLILMKILISPEILQGYTSLYKKINENRSNNLVLAKVWIISTVIESNNNQHQVLKEKIDKNLVNYIERIEKISFRYELFRNSKMTLKDMAYELNIPKSHLSYLFKYHSNLSFSEYKNLIRIHDAIKHLEQNYLEENTLNSLSLKVGFTSYNPFFTSFKEIAGVSPQEYNKNCMEEIAL